MSSPTVFLEQQPVEAILAQVAKERANEEGVSVSSTLSIKRISLGASLSEALELFCELKVFSLLVVKDDTNEPAGWLTFDSVIFHLCENCSANDFRNISSVAKLVKKATEATEEDFTGTVQDLYVPGVKIVPANLSLISAARLLEGDNKFLAVSNAKGKLCFALTARDIVKTVVRRYGARASFKESLKDTGAYNNKPLICVSSSGTVDQAFETLGQWEEAYCAPVVDVNLRKLMGAVSPRDVQLLDWNLVSYLGMLGKNVSSYLREIDDLKKEKLVVELDPVFARACSPASSVKDAAVRILKDSASGIPIGENGNLTGTCTVRHLLAFILHFEHVRAAQKAALENPNPPLFIDTWSFGKHKRVVPFVDDFYHSDILYLYNHYRYDLVDDQGYYDFGYEYEYEYEFESENGMKNGSSVSGAADRKLASAAAGANLVEGVDYEYLYEYEEEYEEESESGIISKAVDEVKKVVESESGTGEYEYEYESESGSGEEGGESTGSYEYEYEYEEDD